MESFKAKYQTNEKVINQYTEIIDKNMLSMKSSGSAELLNFTGSPNHNVSSFEDSMIENSPSPNKYH